VIIHTQYQVFVFYLGLTKAGKKFEFDIWIPSANVAIEYQGTIPYPSSSLSID
jgi:hypothetical protein